MRVDRLTVSGFGKLAGSALEPGPELTVVHGPNESGKSTTHAALRAGLFGLVAGGRRDRDDRAAPALAGVALRRGARARRRARPPPAPGVGLRPLPLHAPRRGHRGR